MEITFPSSAVGTKYRETQDFPHTHFPPAATIHRTETHHRTSRLTCPPHQPLNYRPEYWRKKKKKQFSEKAETNPADPTRIPRAVFSRNRQCRNKPVQNLCRKQWQNHPMWLSTRTNFTSMFDTCPAAIINLPQYSPNQHYLPRVFEKSPPAVLATCPLFFPIN